MQAAAPNPLSLVEYQRRLVNDYKEFLKPILSPEEMGKQYTYNPYTRCMDCLWYDECFVFQEKPDPVVKDDLFV